MERVLFITEGGQKGKTFSVTGETITIGRDRRNLFVVDDDEISRYHCEVTFENGQVFLEDLCSSNGTFLNGKMIRRSTLKRGDKIRIGNTHIQFNDSLYVVADDGAESATQVTTEDNTESNSVAIDLESGSSYLESLADQADSSVDARFVQINNDLRFLYRASITNSKSIDASQKLDELMKLIFDWIEADQGYVLMKSPDEAEFSVRIKRKRETIVGPDFDVQIYQSIIEYVRKNQVGVLSRLPMFDQRWRVIRSETDSQSEPSTLRTQFRNESDSKEYLKNISEVMCVPIQGRGELLGLIYIDVLSGKSQTDPKSVNRFNEDHLRLMMAMAHQAAIAIENETYYQAMVEKERMAAIGETATLMTHRINNIIQGINGGSHIVDVGLKKNDLSMIQKGWNIVNGNQAKISQLINDLLILGKPFIPNKSQAELFPIAESSISDLENLFKNAHIEISIQKVYDDSSVQIDIQAFKLSIESLVRVVVSACRNRTAPRITVGFKNYSGNFRVDFVYSGSEICLDAEQFSNDPAGESDRVVGGLEFAVCRKIIRGHGGDVVLKDREDGLRQVSVSVPRD